MAFDLTVFVAYYQKKVCPLSKNSLFLEVVMALCMGKKKENDGHAGFAVENGYFAKKD